MARGRGVAVLGPRLGIRGLTRGMWGGNGDVKIITCWERGACHDGVWQKVREFIYVLLVCSQYSSWRCRDGWARSPDGRGRSVGAVSITGVVVSWALWRLIALRHEYSAPVRCYCQCPAPAGAMVSLTPCHSRVSSYIVVYDTSELLVFYSDLVCCPGEFSLLLSRQLSLRQILAAFHHLRSPSSFVRRP